MLFPLCPRGTTWDAMVSADIVSPDSNVPWPFNERKILYIISCIAKALQFMHDKGFAHRDVKPHNILLADPPATSGGSHSNDADIRQVGIPLLMDFGSVAAARCEVKNKSQGMNLEEEAASKTSAAYRYPSIHSIIHMIQILSSCTLSYSWMDSIDYVYMYTLPCFDFFIALKYYYHNAFYHPCNATERLS